MNFRTFYYLAILIVIAAKLFGYFSISWTGIIILTLLPFFIAVITLLVKSFIETSPSKTKSNRK